MPAGCRAAIRSFMPGALAAARRFRDGLRRFAATRPVHGECGGYMVLGEGLEDAAGRRHAMTGLLGHATSFAKRKLHLGYREARLLADSPIGPAGAPSCAATNSTTHRCSSAGNDEPLADLRDAQGRELGKAGGRRGHVTGTFFHAIANSRGLRSAPSGRLVGHARLGKGRHAGVAGQRRAQHRHRQRRARGFAEPHAEIEQRHEAESSSSSMRCPASAETWPACACASVSRAASPAAQPRRCRRNRRAAPECAAAAPPASRRGWRQARGRRAPPRSAADRRAPRRGGRAPRR